MRSRYHKILGVPDGASKEAIKKAFRRKALQYHPDVNKSANAHTVFMELQEAYEALINDKVPASKAKAYSRARTATTTRQRPQEAEKAKREGNIKNAAERARQRHEKILKEGLEFYKKYQRSWKRKFTTLVMFLSVSLGVVLCFDYFLPPSNKKVLVKFKYYIDDPAGLDHATYLVLSDGKELSVPEPVYSHVEPDDAIIIKRTAVFKLPVEVIAQRHGYPYPLSMDNTLFNWFWLLIILMFLPLLRYKLDRPHVSYYFLEFSTRTGVLVAVLFVSYQLIFKSVW